MSEKDQPRQITLFVCVDGEICRQAVTFMRGWANGCPDAVTEIISIADQPEQVVRLGITHTPALVIDGRLIAQNLSINALDKLLRQHWPGTKAAPQLSG